VVIPIGAELYNQLRVALPFYSGKWQSGVTIWSDRIRVAQQKAGIWKKGSLVHRGRDSFVERQIVAGVPIAVIAARIGDLVSTMERHYLSLLSTKMRDLNLAQPVVTSFATTASTNSRYRRNKLLSQPMQMARFACGHRDRRSGNYPAQPQIPA
jgi:hypothetical protein